MRTKRYAAALIAACIIMIGFSLPAFAAQSLAVAVNHSTVLNVYSVDKVAVANPDIADVIVVSGSEVVVVGKAPGITTLHVWSSSGRSTYEVEVGANDTMIADTVKGILNYPNIKVSKVGKTIIIEGTVNDQYQKNRAEKVAGAYGDKVVNLLELTSPKQVKIEARVLEISKDKVDNLGIKWGWYPETAPGVFYAGQSPRNINSIPSEKDKFGWFGSYADINAQIDALVQNGYAKILSQPNVITISGEKANILVGGEIPIPVAVNNNQITIEWKEYGIKLGIEPSVSAEGLISSRVKAEVSSIDYSNPKAMVNIGNGLVIPALKTRKAETAITMQSGQTMAIGGLIASSETKAVTKFPLLSEIPVLGQLFTSKAFDAGKTEVVIVLTPSLINPIEYNPPTSPVMKEWIAENPWSVKQDDSQQNVNNK